MSKSEFPPLNTNILYQGWSGCVVESPVEANPIRIAIDPAPSPPLPAAPIAILLTHGHPEHLSGAIAHIERQNAHPTTIIASTQICAYLQSLPFRSLHVHFQPIQYGQPLQIGPWTVEAFPWEHAPLLPDGFFCKAKFLAKLLLHPLVTARIALQGFRKPLWCPMIGFRLRRNNGPVLVYFGEGFHRHTTKECLLRAIGHNGVDVMITGVEPEDLSAISEALVSTPVRRTVVFEPHRQWREELGLPLANLQGLKHALSQSGIHTSIPLPGSALML